MSIQHEQHGGFNADANLVEENGDIVPYVEPLATPDYLKNLPMPTEHESDDQLNLDFEEAPQTKQREFVAQEDREDPWEGTGYGRPYKADDLTVDQARALRSQHAGGPDALRIAKRADDVEAANAALGSQDGMPEKMPLEQQLENAKRYEARTRADVRTLEIQLHKTPSAQIRARLESRKNVHQDALDRVDRLELPGKVVELDAAIIEAQKRVDAAKYGIAGREANGRDLLIQRRERYVRRLGELGVTLDAEQ